MVRVQRSLIVVAVFVLGGLLLASPVFFEILESAVGPGARHWLAAFIYDFQTLIAGILAVGAAGWTVVTMEKTDREAANRHSQLVELQLRPDSLRIQRMVFPAYYDLLGSRRIMALFDCEAIESRFDTDPTVLIEDIDRIRKCAAIAEAVFRIEAVVKASDLFGGRLTHNLERLKIALIKIQSSSARLITYVEYFRTKVGVSDAQDLTSKASAIDDFRENVGDGVSAFNIVIEEIEMLESAYRRSRVSHLFKPLQDQS